MTGSVVPPTTISDDLAMALHDAFFHTKGRRLMGMDLWRLMAERLLLDQCFVAAAVPYIEAGLREKLATEIEAAALAVEVHTTRGAGIVNGMAAAARVARGTQEATNG